MKLAFIIYQYFPYGGLQRDFKRIAEACLGRKHEVDIFCESWQGPELKGAILHTKRFRAMNTHSRQKKFHRWVLKQFELKHYDCVVGFNKMPDLDLYFAAEPCFQEKALHQRLPLYRLGAHYKHYYACEKSVFGHESNTHILLLSESQKPQYMEHYHTPDRRIHLLPAGVSRDRRAPENAADIRAQYRHTWSVQENEYLVLMLTSNFKSKGLDRSIRAVASLSKTLREKTHLFVLGQDDPKPYEQLAKDLDIEDRVRFLAGRDDAPQFLQAADLLVNPAYHEHTGIVVLEALVAGLPVITTSVCHYAHFIQQAKAGAVLSAPFVQETFNQKLSELLLSTKKSQWRSNALAYAESHDLYELPERAVDEIESRAKLRH